MKPKVKTGWLTRDDYKYADYDIRIGVKRPELSGGVYHSRCAPNSDYSFCAIRWGFLTSRNLHLRRGSIMPIKLIADDKGLHIVPAGKAQKQQTINKTIGKTCEARWDGEDWVMNCLRLVGLKKKPNFCPFCSKPAIAVGEAVQK